MKTINKIMVGGAAVATLAFAGAPAQAQYGYYDYDRYDTDRTISQVVSGIAAVAGAVRGYSPYGYSTAPGYSPYGYGYGSNSWGYAPYGYSNYRYVSGEQIAVNACGSQAQRFGGAVRVTDVDRRNRNRFRVHGIIDDGRYGDRWGWGRDLRFSCTARYDGRVTDFDTRRL
jgi:hypothetical protein